MATTSFPPLCSPPYLRRIRCNNLSPLPNHLRRSKPLICTFTSNLTKSSSPMDSFSPVRVQSSGGSGVVPDLGLVQRAIQLVQLSPSTWQSAIVSNLLIFVAGSPILVTGLSVSGIAAAFLLGTLTWRGFGPSGFLLVAVYFVIVSCFYPKSKLIFSDQSKLLLFCAAFVLIDIEILAVKMARC
ncbi:hypothetical protein SSX86_032889 [Deinandra increscens subsp. villosa]|uniref:Uncharacterized protein n=1 Tax=Deinandra increscens subsp. villosa TaxID=3103831 RepID=A0AAP0GGB1_9ASTR